MRDHLKVGAACRKSDEGSISHASQAVCVQHCQLRTGGGDSCEASICDGGTQVDAELSQVCKVRAGLLQPGILDVRDPVQNERLQIRHASRQGVQQSLPIHSSAQGQIQSPAVNPSPCPFQDPPILIHTCTAWVSYSWGMQGSRGQSLSKPEKEQSSFFSSPFHYAAYPEIFSTWLVCASALPYNHSNSSLQCPKAAFV